MIYCCYKEAMSSPNQNSVEELRKKIRSFDVTETFSSKNKFNLAKFKQLAQKVKETFTHEDSLRSGVTY